VPGSTEPADLVLNGGPRDPAADADCGKNRSVSRSCWQWFPLQS
jgi:hypothetical protein